MSKPKTERTREKRSSLEDSVAIFAVPFILALGVAVFFILMEILRRIL